MKKILSALLIGLSLTASLGGCAALLVGGGATAGTLSATDRRTTGAQTDDQVMELRIKNDGIAYLNTQPQNNSIKPALAVVSYNRQVLLLGMVNNQADKDQIERIARSQQAAQQVFNYIDIIDQNRTLGHVTDDTWITSKVRTNLLKTKGVTSNYIKVVTYNGVVYAMGILTPEEQNIATQVISTTAGVQKVVTLYQTFNPVPAADNQIPQS